MKTLSKADIGKAIDTGDAYAARAILLSLLAKSEESLFDGALESVLWRMGNSWPKRTESGRIDSRAVCILNALNSVDYSVRTPPQGTSLNHLRAPILEVFNRLPPFDFTSRENGEPDFYGASDCISFDLGLIRNLPSRATWTHGWSKNEVFIETDFNCHRRKSVANLVYTKFIKDKLLELGYSNLHVVGAPFLYARQVDVPRIHDSVLFVPSHSSESLAFRHSGSLSKRHLNLIEECKAHNVFAACIGAKDVQLGNFIEAFEEENIPWVTGAWILDRNALVRMQRIFRSFEYVVSDAVGSHVAYAAFCGCKVILLKDSCYDNKPVPLYDLREEYMIRASEAAIRSSSDYLQEVAPFLFSNFHTAKSQVDWAREELGYYNIVPSAVVGKILGWERYLDESRRTSGWERHWLSCEELLRLSQLKETKREFNAAISLHKAVLSRNPKYGLAHYLLIRLCLKLYQFQDASTAMSAAVTSGLSLRDLLSLQEFYSRNSKQEPSYINHILDITICNLCYFKQATMRFLTGIMPLVDGLVLHVGCGIMPYKQLLTDSNPRITRYIGLDIETETYQADVDLRWDGRTIPLEDASVDSAMATEVLEHCPEPLVVLKEICRVLKPGGVFFFTVPYIWPLHDAPYDFWRYTPFSLKKLLSEAGFADVDVRALSGWNASLAQMMGLWLKRAPMTQEKRNEMAQKLWPLYQELVTTDQLPDNPDAGNTMATGWSGIAYAPVDAAEQGEQGDGSDAAPEACDFPLLFVRSHAANYSETFIEDHVRYISRNCTVLYGWPLPRIVGDRSVLADDLERSLQQAIGAGGTLSAELMEAYARGLAAWIGKQGFAVALLESGLMGSCLHKACERAKLPFVIHFHGVDAFGKDLLAQWGDHYRRAFKSAHSVIGVSRAMVSQLVALGAPQDKVILGPYGVDVDPPRLAKPTEAGPQFIAVGRFVDKKAPHKTLQAFEAVYRKVPTARLVMIGDGPLLKRCQQWVKEQGIEDAVTFMGVQSRATVSRMMSLSRAFVQHSVTADNGDSEGLPLAVLEAGAHGLPVIATRHAGIPDAVVENECGFLVDEHDVLGMAKAMLRIAKDGELAARMGTAFRQRVSDYYSRKVSIERLQGILKSAAAGDVSARLPVANQAAALPLPEDSDELLQLLSRDRSHGPAYVKLATQAAQAGNYEEAYLYFKEAERVGGLPEGARGMLTALEAHPDLDTEAVRTYRGLIAPGAFGQAEQRRRILVFTNLLPPQEMGGYGRTVWEFCDGLIQRGHDVRILTADLPELAQEPYADYQRVEQHVERTLKLFGGWERGEIKEETDEKVIIAKALHNVRTIKAAVSRFKPDICMAGNLDLMSGAMLDPILKQGIPVLHRLGNAIPGYAVDATPQSELYCIAGCSQWINDNLVKEGYRPKHFAVLPAGAPLNEYYRLVPPSFDKLRICFAGLVMPYKGPQLLIGALGMLHKLGIDFTCEIAGEQKDADFIAHLLKYVRIGGFEEKVRWNGFLNRNQLAAMFSRNNTFVFPSVFEEPFGKVQIEAQAAGLAVVRSAVGGYKDMLEDEVNGLLFKPNDAEDLARQLYVLQGDKELWAKIAAQGQVDAFRFTTSNCVTILDDLMGELLAKRP